MIVSIDASIRFDEFLDPSREDGEENFTFGEETPMEERKKVLRYIGKKLCTYG